MTSDNLIVTQDGSDLSKAEQILREHRIEKLPVVDSDGQLRASSHTGTSSS